MSFSIRHSHPDRATHAATAAVCDQMMVVAQAGRSGTDYLSVLSGTKFGFGFGGAIASFKTLNTRWSSGEDTTKSL